jgi:hypothetical protein
MWNGCAKDRMTGFLWPMLISTMAGGIGNSPCGLKVRYENAALD